MLIQAGRSPQLPCAVGAARLAASRVVRRWAPGGRVGPCEPPARQGPSGRTPQPEHDPLGPSEPWVGQDPPLAQGPPLQGEREAHPEVVPGPGAAGEQAPAQGETVPPEPAAQAHPGPRRHLGADGLPRPAVSRARSRSSLSAWPRAYHDTPAPSTPGSVLIAQSVPAISTSC